MRKLVGLLTLVMACFTCSSVAEEVEYSTTHTVHVFADSHGDFQSLITLLKNADIINNNLDWIAGKDHLVSTGDMLDRGAESRKILDFLIKLQQQARAAGGQFHVLLGNHEIMNMIGDLRYVARGEYNAFAEDESDEMRRQAYQHYLLWLNTADSEAALNTFNSTYPRGYFALLNAYSADGKYGQWMLEQPIVLKVNNSLFAHAGLSHRLPKTTLKKLNEQFKSDLRNFLVSWKNLQQANQLFEGLNDQQKRDIAAQLSHANIDGAAELYNLSSSIIFGIEGPVWYRGNAFCHRYTEQENMHDILTHFDAKRLFVGHSITPTKQVTSRFDQQLIMMDTGMNHQYYGGNGSLASIKGNDISLTYVDPVPTPVIQPGWTVKLPYPNGWLESDVEQALRQGEVTAIKDLDTGVTKPQKLTMTYQGHTFHALFKTIDTDPNLPNRRWIKQFDYSDRYQNEIAAYRISKLLGLQTVPVAIEREVNGQMGVVQFWLENTISEYQLDDKNRFYVGFCDLQQQHDLMSIFDSIILNVDRNSTNILYDQEYWQLWLIDHSRSFGTGVVSRKVRNTLQRAVSPELKQAIRAIDRDELERELDGLLHRNQIKALIKRLKYFD